MVFGILGDQYGGIIVWAYTFQKKNAVRKLCESEISHFDFLKIEENFFFQKPKKKQKNFF